MTVTLSRTDSKAVSVKYSTVNGTADSKSDFTASTGTLTFQAGETKKKVTVAIKGDQKREPNETFTVRLSNAVGATLEDSSGAVTILNDD